MNLLIGTVQPCSQEVPVYDGPGSLLRDSTQLLGPILQRRDAIPGIPLWPGRLQVLLGPEYYVIRDREGQEKSKHATLDTATSG